MRVRRALSLAPNDENLAKLDFRLKLARVRAMVGGFFGNLIRLRRS